MRFVTGARARSVKYVVRPSRTINDLATGLREQTPPLRVEFKDHKWDSQSPGAQMQFEEFARWSENTRNPMTVEEVEQMVLDYIQRHPDWNRGDGTGIFADQSAQQRTVTVQASVETGRTSAQMTARCLHFKEMGGDTVQCPNPAADNVDQLCAAHAAEAETASVGV